MQTSSDSLIAALESWNNSRQRLELARSQLAQARTDEVPPAAMELLKAEVAHQEAHTEALFEAAMVFMERRPLSR